MGTTENTDMEQRIVLAAKQVFIEKGFAEASMSDIAARVGINRPALHYYFRTKDRMFEAVFADIVLSFVPSVHNIILQDKPVSERIAEMVDAYFDLFRKEPRFPIFMAQEIQRDAAHLLDAISKLGIGRYATRIKNALHTEMRQGTINDVPMDFILYTFYGLVVIPFIGKPLGELVFGDGVDFEEKLQAWKAHVIRQMELLLCPADSPKSAADSRE